MAEQGREMGIFRSRGHGPACGDDAGPGAPHRRDRGGGVRSRSVLDAL